MTAIPAERWFLDRGECPECQGVVETLEYSVTNPYDETRVVEIEECQECEKVFSITDYLYGGETR